MKCEYDRFMRVFKGPYRSLKGPLRSFKGIWEGPKKHLLGSLSDLYPKKGPYH